MTNRRQYKHSDRSETVADLTAKLEKGVENVFSSAEYTNYLKTMAAFHEYSFNNSMLIFMQKPDATLVAGYQSWIKDHKRHVKAGEKGIRILAPCKKKIIVEKNDEDADNEDEKQTVELKHLYFRPVTVFDISQTEGEDLPDICHKLKGNVEDFDKYFKAFSSVSSVPVVVEDFQSEASGYYSDKEKQIVLKSGMPQAQTLKTLIHEITHSILHSDDKADDLDRETKEVQAESTTYVVCSYYGLDTSDYSFGYIAGWSSDKDVKELKASLEIIRDTANKLITEIDKQLK